MTYRAESDLRSLSCSVSDHITSTSVYLSVNLNMASVSSSPGCVETFSLLNGKARRNGRRRKAAEKEEEQQRSEWKKYKQHQEDELKELELELMNMPTDDEEDSKLAEAAAAAATAAARSFELRKELSKDR